MAATPNQSPHSNWSKEARLVYYGLFVVFIAKFGKFVAHEVWDAIGPVLMYLFPGP